MRKPRKKYVAKEYQELIVNFMQEHDRCAVWAGMGMGKTSAVLTYIDQQLMMGDERPKLVLAPLLVAKTTWEDEALKWDHLRGIRVAPIVGNELERRRAMASKAEVYTTNYENLPWLVEYWGDRWPYETVIADESTKLKNFRTRQGGKRSQALSKVAHSKVKSFIELTGTPAPNGLKDLWGQMWMLDAGKRLGRTYSAFEDRWFKISAYGDDRTPKPFDHSEKEIHGALKDICLTVNAGDWVSLREPVVTNKYVQLPNRARELYQQMEDEFFIELEGHGVEASNAAIKSGKLLQLAGGAVYVDPLTESDDDPRAVHFKEVHDAKIQALESIVNEACGMPVLVATNFRSDAVRLIKAFPKGSILTSKNGHLLMPKWNEGRIPIMFTHPACLHGDTEVLTEFRGWRKMVEVTSSERVFDGLEFVSHEGCSYSGFKNVVDCFGILMTGDHKVLVNDRWMEARYARVSRDIRRKASYTYQGNDKGLSKMFELQGNQHDTLAELREAQPKETDSLSDLRTRRIPSVDQHPYMEFVEGAALPSKGLIGQGLRRTRNISVRILEFVRDFLQRHAPNLFGGRYDREDRREQGLLERELHLGYDVRATSEQAHDTTVNFSRSGDTLGRTVPTDRSEPLHSNHEIESRDERRQSGFECETVSVQEESKEAHVYDLVNCGPRNRFLIRNKEGEVFVSHNSAGHGLNLQDGGNILVFFNLGWNLEHRLQVLERIGPMRQLQAGHNRPVFIYNIVGQDTIDEMVLERMDSKKSVQDVLLNAMAKRKRR